VIVVVGGRGVIGGAIVARARAAGQEVITVTHSAQHANANGFRYGDMLNPGTLPAAVQGADVVVQAANFPTYPIERRRRGQTFMAFDGVGTEQLVAAAQAAGVRRYVFISGAGARSGGDRPYWEALRRGEDAVLESEMEAVCIEPTLVFGPRDRGLNRILGFARRMRFVPLVGSGDEIHQPIFIDDLAEVVARALSPGAPEGAFAVGGRDRLPMRELVRRTLAAAGLPVRLLHVPVPVARFGAHCLRRLPGEVLSPAAIDFMLEDFVAEPEPVATAFGVSPTPLELGLRSYLRAS
jgi:nucleoside-diphosphate-sugar epimerase